MEQNIFSEIWCNVCSNSGGTFNLQGESPKEGYMVSVLDHEEVCEKEEFESNPTYILEYIESKKHLLNSTKTLYIGVWLNEGKYYMDLSERISSKWKAVSLGMLRDQKAIWDLNKNVEVSLPERQKSGTYTQQSTYLNQKVREIVERM